MNNEDAKLSTSFISAFLVLLIGRLLSSSFIFALKEVDHFYFLFSNDDTMAKGKVSSSSGGSTAIESTVKRVTESER